MVAICLTPRYSIPSLNSRHTGLRRLWRWEARMTDKTFKQGLLFIIYVMYNIASICMFGFGKSISALLLMLVATMIAIVIAVYGIRGKE
jgi:hypothetical protein